MEVGESSRCCAYVSLFFHLTSVMFRNRERERDRCEGSEENMPSALKAFKVFVLALKTSAVPRKSFRRQMLCNLEIPKFRASRGRRTCDLATETGQHRVWTYIQRTVLFSQMVYSIYSTVTAHGRKSLVRGFLSRHKN